MSRTLAAILALAAAGFLIYPACGPRAMPEPVAQSAVAPSAAPKPALAPVAAGTAAPARPAPEVELEKVAAAAKQEGKLVLFNTFGGQQRQIITKPFESKYGIRIEAMTGVTSELVAKISAERRAGIYSLDASVSGSTSYSTFKGLLDPIDSSLMLPELLEPDLVKKTWYFGEVPWANKAHNMLIGLMSFNEVIGTNTNLVKPGEINSYRDLLDPKWKGKMSLQDPRISSMGLMWFAVAQDVGDVDANFMRDLATKQELFITRDRRLQVEWLAHGKHAIALGPHTDTFAEFMRLGAPINRFNLGTPFVSGSTSGIGLWEKAPDPNAAKLFINWLLSQEGATFHSQTVGAQSQRLDVPTTHLEPSKVLKPGLKIFRSDQEEFATKKDSYYINLAKEIFGASTK